MPRPARKNPYALERTEQSGKKEIKTKGWSDKRRAAQRARCLSAKPWESATGPRTDSGKATSSENALRHGLYDAAYRDLSHLLLIQCHFVQAVMDRAGLVAYKKT
jgi:hypothetical protein